MVSKQKLCGEVQAHMECRAKVMKALAHSSRLFIVDELSRGERCVCELTEMIGADVSTVSKHLAVLREAVFGCRVFSTSSAVWRRCSRRRLGKEPLPAADRCCFKKYLAKSPIIRNQEA